MSTAPPQPPVKKSDRTRTAILETALRLFEERGYQQTTMRAVAHEADVSVGNAYYYFASKQHLIQAFYDRLQAAHAAKTQAVIDGEHAFAARLRGAMAAWLEVSRPYHEFAASFFKNAADPESPLSPFSPEAEPAREASIDIWRDVVDGSDLKLPSDIQAALPELLWLYQMGIVLCWVYDRSDGLARTRELIDGTVPLIDRLARLTRVPVFRGVARDLVEVGHRLHASGVSSA